MLGAIYTSLSGMNAYSSGLDTISNNVANMNTAGFKLSSPLFRDLMYQYGGNIGNGNAATQSRGAGVHADTVLPSLRAGELRETGNELDVAIDGTGFFVLDQDGHRVYTRAGQFEFDTDGILVERITGARVMVSTATSGLTHFDLSDLRVFAPRVTSEVTLQGTLVRAAVGATGAAFTLSAIRVIDTAGEPLLLSARMTPSTDTPARATTTVVLSGTLERPAAGAAVAYSLPSMQVFDTTGAALQLTANLTPDATDPLHWSVSIVDANNVVQGTGDIRFNDDGTPATGSSSFAVTVTPATGPTFSVNFDFGTTAGVTSATDAVSLLTASQDGAAAAPRNPLQWSVDILNENNVVQGSGVVLFNDNGTPATGGNAFTVTITPTTGPTFDVSFNFGAPGTYTGVTSPRPPTTTGGATGTVTTNVSVLDQNGVQLGTITKTEFTEKGELKVTYSNGEDLMAATLVIAQFDTPEQLRALGGARFGLVGTREPVMGAALDAGLGRIAGGKLEMSNVDLTNQFSDLILVQRGFQGCSQITTVANEMMQQLLSMSGKG